MRLNLSEQIMQERRSGQAGTQRGELKAALQPDPIA